MAAHRAPHNNLSKYLPSKEAVLRVTAAAAFLTSAIFGGIKLGEGFAQGKDQGGYTLVEDESAGQAFDKIVDDSVDTFVDLSLGVGGVTLAGLIVAGSVMQYRRRYDYADDETYENAANEPVEPIEPAAAPAVSQETDSQELPAEEFTYVPAADYGTPAVLAPAASAAVPRRSPALANEDREREFAGGAPSCQPMAF